MKLDRQLLGKTRWFLDFDGSLCPHLEVWEERTYDPQRIYKTVRALNEKTLGAIWNTGRRCESLASVHKGFLDFSGYFIHGSMHWEASSRTLETLAPEMPASITVRFEEALQKYRELRLEKKPTGLRVAPFDPVSYPAVRKFVDSKDFFTPDGWRWTVGARGAELLPEGFDKATGLRRDLKDNAIPVVIGDDRFDGPAFEEALKRGGYAILVGENCGFVTSMKHQSWQTIYCDDSEAVMKLIDDLL